MFLGSCSLGTRLEGKMWERRCRPRGGVGQASCSQTWPTLQFCPGWRRHSKDTLSPDCVTILGRVTGQYNSNLDIHPEDHRRPGRPKDKTSGIFTGINLIVPTKLSSLKAKTSDFSFFYRPHSTLNSSRNRRFSILTCCSMSIFFQIAADVLDV